jgi:hypothetical protein
MQVIPPCPVRWAMTTPLANVALSASSPFLGSRPQQTVLFEDNKEQKKKKKHGVSAHSLQQCCVSACM